MSTPLLWILHNQKRYQLSACVSPASPQEKKKKRTSEECLLTTASLEKPINCITSYDIHVIFVPSPPTLLDGKQKQNKNAFYKITIIKKINTKAQLCTHSKSLVRLLAERSPALAGCGWDLLDVSKRMCVTTRNLTEDLKHRIVFNEQTRLIHFLRTTSPNWPQEKSSCFFFI